MSIRTLYSGCTKRTLCSSRLIPLCRHYCCRRRRYCRFHHLRFRWLFNQRQIQPSEHKISQSLYCLDLPGDDHFVFLRRPQPLCSLFHGSGPLLQIPPRCPCPPAAGWVWYLTYLPFVTLPRRPPPQIFSASFSLSRGWSKRQKED